MTLSEHTQIIEQAMDFVADAHHTILNPEFCELDELVNGRDGYKGILRFECLTTANGVLMVEFTYEYLSDSVEKFRILSDDEAEKRWVDLMELPFVGELHKVFDNQWNYPDLD